MMIQKLLKSEKLLHIEKLLREEETLLFEQLFNAPKALLATLAAKATGKHLLILTGGSTEEVRLYTDFKYFSDLPIIDFPAWETLPSENVAPSPDIVGERYLALSKALEADQPHIIISSLQGSLQKLMPKKRFVELKFALKKGDKTSFIGMIEKLEKMGYHRKSVVTDKGEYAVRGGIIDLYPVSSPDPFRVEFWDDEIESIRTFDPVGQKSIQQVEGFELVPGLELELLKGEKAFEKFLYHH